MRLARADTLLVHPERPGEGFDPGQQPLLQVDEHQLAASLLGAHQLGVLLQHLPQLQLGGAPFADERGLVVVQPGVPLVVLVAQVDLYDLALGELIHPQLAKIALQAANHDRFELPEPAHGHAPGEPLWVEDLQESREAVGVAVVGRG